MNPPDPPPLRPASTPTPTPEKLQEMNASAAETGSKAENGVQPCPKKSWFAIRVIDEKESKVVEALTIKLNIPDLGETDRVTSTGRDPIKIEELAPGGKGSVKRIDADLIWEAVGDIT